MLIRKCVLFAVLLAAIPAAAQKLVEKVVRQGNEIVIPYSKFVYPNGLTLIVHEDHSDPIVHVDVTYHVGSAREEIGKSGFAHFFEHMMFQGSDHVADEEHFRLVTEAGGTMNGTTNMDRTNYFQTVPNNQLERVLWLEADRMGFLLDAVTQKKFEVQRATVKNERGQRYDNRPYGLVREKTSQALYPYGHPYSWPTIGYLEDLNRVDVNDLKKFFLRWYGPNNAVITIAGDVKTEEVTKLVNKYFGSIPAGPEVKPMEKQVPSLDQDRYISYGDNIRFPLLQMSWPVVPLGHPDEAALDAAAYLLSHSKSSPMHQRFVKSGKAMSANLYNYTQELSGTFNLSLYLMPGVKPAEAEKEVREVLQEFSKNPIKQEDLQKFITSREVNAYRWLESVSFKASMLAHYETMLGNPNRIGADLKQYQTLTPEQVKRAFDKYIPGQPAVILTAYPKGQEELVAAPDNFTPKLPDPSGSDPNLYGDLKYVKAKDDFDRSQKPVPGANPVITVPALWKHNFKGASRATGMISSESPTVSAVLYFPAGHVYESPDKAGLASLTATMLNEGTVNSTAEQLESRLEALGSSVSFSSNDEKIVMSIYSLKKNLDSTMAIAQEMLFHPRFDEADFNREKRQVLEAINNRSTQPSVIASTVFEKLIYGEDDVRGTPSSGTAASVETITLQDVRNWHSNMVEGSSPDLVVVGDIEKEAAVRHFTFLDRFTAARKPLPALDTERKPASRYYLVHRPDAAQSEIRVGYLALPYDATGEYFKATVMNYALGGGFNSRINLNLREDKGYTYGARGSFNGSTYAGPYLVSTAVRTDATDSALAEIFKEIRNYRTGGITAEELAFTRSSIGQAEALRYETPWQKAGFLNRLQEYGLPSDYTRRQQEMMNAMTLEEIKALAEKHLPLEEMVVVIVGDREKIGEPLKKMDVQFIELDAEGNPL